MLEQLHEKYPQEVRIVYRHFPLSFHDKSLLASQASEAADLQGKFWEMHNAIFSKAQEWTQMTPADFEKWLIAQAGSLGLNVDQFTADMKSVSVIAIIKASSDVAQRIGLPGTPFVMANFQPIQGQNVPNLEVLSTWVELFKLKDRQFSECPPLVDATKQYTATITTSKGDFVIKLYADKAPMTVSSFVFLAQQGWFNGVPFHRVLTGFVAQTGDPSGSGVGGPGYQFTDEFSPDLKFDKAGLLGMANSGANTNGSQFFITLAPTPDLNGKHTIFGEVTSGMDVVNQLTPRDPDQGNMPPADTITGVKIEVK